MDRRKKILIAVGIVAAIIVSVVLGVIIAIAASRDTLLSDYTKQVDDACFYSKDLSTRGESLKKVLKKNPELVNFIYVPKCKLGLLAEAVVQNQTDMLSWLLNTSFIDPSLVTKDGKIETALSIAKGVAWGQPMVELLEAKMAEINRKREKIPRSFQDLQFPAKFSNVPPILLMATAQRASSEAANGGGTPSPFGRWIDLIKSYSGKKELTFDHQMRPDDIKFKMVPDIADSLWGEPSVCLAEEFGDSAKAKQLEEQHNDASAAVRKLLDPNQLNARRRLWNITWTGELREEDLNYQLIYIYTGSEAGDEGKEIFWHLNQVAAKQGNDNFVPTAHDLTFFPFAAQLQVAIISDSPLKYKCDEHSPEAVSVAGGFYCRLFRGVKNVPENVMSIYTKDARVLKAAFTSLSKTVKRAMDAGICKASLSAGSQDYLFEIHLPPAIPRRFVPIDIESSISQHPNEREVLAPMGAAYKVLEDVKIENCPSDSGRPGGNYTVITLELTQ